MAQIALLLALLNSIFKIAIVAIHIWQEIPILRDAIVGVNTKNVQLYRLGTSTPRITDIFGLLQVMKIGDLYSVFPQWTT